MKKQSFCQQIAARSVSMHYKVFYNNTADESLTLNSQPWKMTAGGNTAFPCRLIKLAHQMVTIR